jgi:hypothetical protein
VWAERTLGLERLAARGGAGWVVGSGCVVGSGRGR